MAVNLPAQVHRKHPNTGYTIIDPTITADRPSRAVERQCLDFYSCFGFIVLLGGHGGNRQDYAMLRDLSLIVHKFELARLGVEIGGCCDDEAGAEGYLRESARTYAKAGIGRYTRPT